jgi:hypothetical protein
MKKLKLDDLEVKSFSTTAVSTERGTVNGHSTGTSGSGSCWSFTDCSYDECGVNSRFDCSIDFCSHGGGCGPTIAM